MREYNLRQRKAALIRADGLAELAEGPIRELGHELRAALDHVEHVGGPGALWGVLVFLGHVALNVVLMTGPG